MKSATTIKDIARKADVSIATVSRYLNKSGYVSKELQERIQKVVKESDYIPNQVAISLKTTETKIIGIVTPELSNFSLVDTVKAISDVVMKNGYQPIIMSSSEDKITESKILDVLISRQVDGVVIASAGTDIEKIIRINEKRFPVVLFDRDVCNKGDQILLDAVVNDNFNGSYRMINYLLSLNHRNIAILTGNVNLAHIRKRLDGYLKALQDSHIPINPDYIKNITLDFNGGYEATKQLMSMQHNKPTAIFTLNNISSLGVISALNDLHIQIPQQISVCGFGEFKYHAILHPDLTVVNQCSYEIGKKAAEILIKKINCDGDWNPTKIIIPSDILMRSSCAPPTSQD